MNRRIIIILAVAVIALFLIFGFVIPLATAPLSASMSGQWYKDGKPVGSPFAFVNPGGSEVDSLRVTVSWSATGTNIDTSTFGLGGWVKVSLFQALPGSVKIELQKFLITKSGAAAMAGSEYANFALESLLGSYMEYKTVGWNLVLDAYLSSSVKDANGELLTAIWEKSVNYKLTWNEVSGTFSLTGTLGAGS